MSVRYHDHAIDITAENVGFGQAGAFMTDTPEINQSDTGGD